MDALKLMEQLSRSPFVRSELPMELQIGLPWLEKRGERLCLRVLPHRVDCVEDTLLFYAPRYEVAWVYPFAHLASFRQLSLEAPVSPEPLCRVPVNRMVSVGKYCMDELYEACTKVLDAQEKNGAVTDAQVNAYQKRFAALTADMGLAELYKR